MDQRYAVMLQDGVLFGSLAQSIVTEAPTNVNQKVGASVTRHASHVNRDA